MFRCSLGSSLSHFSEEAVDLDSYRVQGMEKVYL